MRPLKLGIFLPVFEGSDEAFYGIFPRTLRWPKLLGFVRRTEAAGFDSVWVPDHLLFRFKGEQGPSHGLWEGWSILAALAGTTERVELGTLVLCTAFRNPALLAKMADTVDEVSGGRLILGLGAGYQEPEFRAFGYPFDHLGSRFEEALTIITTLLRDGTIDFEGQYYAARDSELRPRAARPGGPPILVAGGFPPGPRMARLAAERADLWNSWVVFDRSYPDVIPPVRERVDAACAKVGRDPATLGRTIAVMVVPPGQAPMPVGPEVQPVVGTAAEVAETLRGFARMGIDHLQLVLNPCTDAAVEAMVPVLALLDQG
ncbi:MAG TPA: LLM class flavin-dependent oxidoreductase [Chloroflexota bacterium]|nr:LLM class flavin-dependent oxidoreductase [Chloroflexota bacterium]